MTDTPTADSWLSSTEEYVLDDEPGDDVPTADDGLSISEEYDLEHPPGPTAEYPPDAAGEGDDTELYFSTETTLDGVSPPQTASMLEVVASTLRDAPVDTAYRLELTVAEVDG